MRRLCFDKFGDPAKVLRLDEQPTPKLGRGQVLMTMTCAPIHPADFALIRGVYVRPDSFPAVPGLEGLGTVTKLGPGVKGVRVGGRYLVVSRGNWASERVVPADGLVPVPKGLADEVACQSFVNPLTAYGLLEMVKRPGAVVQTAAGSAVGRLVDQIGRKQGRKVINIVRSDKTARDLKKHGAAHVVSSQTKNWQSKVMAAAGKTPIVAAFDPVAGETALSLLPLLSERGDLILYGALSGKPVEVGAMSVAGKDLVGARLLAEPVACQRLQDQAQRGLQVARQHAGLGRARDSGRRRLCAGRFQTGRQSGRNIGPARQSRSEIVISSRIFS